MGIIDVLLGDSGSSSGQTQEKPALQYTPRPDIIGNLPMQSGQTNASTNTDTGTPAWVKAFMANNERKANEDVAKTNPLFGAAYYLARNLFGG